MEDYNFWADLLASYRASPDFIKAMWLMVPFVVAAGFFAVGVGIAMRLMERYDAPPVPAEEKEPDPVWLTAVAPALIAHDRTDEAPDRARKP